MKVLIGGATGLIGSALASALARDGHSVVGLTRGVPRGPHEARWDPAAGAIDRHALAGVDAAVHLAGESIAGGRWSPARRRRIRDSRVLGTALLCDALAALPRPPRVLVSGSAIGYYGDRGGETLHEESPPGGGFLAEVAREWEGATASAARRGIRVVVMRTGLVLSARGGALAAMLPLFRMGLGGRLGSGTQWMSWIALEDLVRAMRHALERDTLEGPVNGVAPGAVTNREFTRSLARALGRPALLPAPASALRLALGREMADELLLASQRVEPRRLLASGFAFRFGALDEALGRALAPHEAAPAAAGGAAAGA